MASSEERKKPDLNNLAPETITIKWEGDKHGIKVNKELACYHSRYLHSAFERGWKETETQEIELSDTTGNAIKLFRWWLLAGDLYPQGYPGPTVDDFVELWILCDILAVPVCQNLAIEQIVLAWKQTQPWADTESTERVWACTNSKSGLRRLFLDQIAFNVRMSERTDPEEFTHEIWRDIVIRLKKQIVPPGHGLLIVDLRKYLVAVPDAEIAEEAEPEKNIKDKSKKRKRGNSQEKSDSDRNGQSKSKKSKKGKERSPTQIED
ncbi:hypothetical protein BDZ45DRAFT_737507 [Acephala macrosclerotiorum]|nr:hypothetical protein BDZ45DRAFT_737507 [Acephala macrosclerotiorum]